MFAHTLTLLATAALAHYPHDFAFYVAVSPSDPPAWVATTLFRTEAVMSVRSADAAGVEVFYVFSGTVQDDSDSAIQPSAGELLDEQRLFMATTGQGLWESLDAGETWATHTDIPDDAVLRTLESSPAIASDATALLGGLGGIWRTTDRGDSWTLAADQETELFVDVAYSPDWSSDGRACAITEGGALWCSDDHGESWAVVGPTGASEAWQIAIDDDQRLWVGTGGGLVRSEDSGESWDTVAVDTIVDSRKVTTVEYVGGNVLLLTTERHAVWRSDDDGASWSLHADELQTIQDTEGHGSNHYYEIQRAPDGRIWLASQEGLAYSDDDGLSWRPMETELGDTVRGLAIASGLEDDNPLLLLGSYGSGVNVVDAEVTRANTISFDLNWNYLRSLSAPADWVDSGVVVVTGSGRMFVTNDHGQSWTQTMDTDRYPNRSAAAPDYSADPLLLAAAGEEGAGAFYRSTDHGQTWDETELVGGSCDGGGSAVAFSPEYRSDGLAWAACGSGQLFVSSDGGATWTWLGATHAQVRSMSVTPGGAAVFLGTDVGLFASAEGAAPALVAFGGEEVWGVGASPAWSTQPDVYALTLHQGWHRSTDGGESFEPMATASPQIPLSVTLSPAYGSDGTLAVAGFGGAWVSRDRGESWASAHALEFYQDSQPQLRYDDAWGQMDGETLGAQAKGAQLTVGLRGVGMDFIGPTGADGGSFEAAVDGGSSEWVSTSGSQATRQTLWSVSGLDDGWHEVTITATGDGWVESDAVRYWRLPGVALGPDWPETDTDTDADADTDTDTDADADADADSDADTDTGRDSAAPRDSGSPPPGDRCDGCASAGAPGLGFLALLPLWFRRRRTARRSPLG